MSCQRVYLMDRHFHVGPLDVFRDGTYFTRSRLSSFLSSCFGHAYIPGQHTFIYNWGALTAAGVPDATTLVLGRWASNCFIRFLLYGSITSFSSSLGPLF